MGQRQRHADTQRFEDGQGLAYLASRFTVFEVADETYSGAGRQGEFGVREAHRLALFFNQPAQIVRCY